MKNSVLLLKKYLKELEQYRELVQRIEDIIEAQSVSDDFTEAEAFDLIRNIME